MIDKSNIPILISMPRNGSHYVGNYIREVYKQNGMIFPGTSELFSNCLLYTSPSPRDVEESRMPSSA